MQDGVIVQSRKKALSCWRYVFGRNKKQRQDRRLLCSDRWILYNERRRSNRSIENCKPRLAIPMHFNTLDNIKANPNEFKEKAEKLGFKVRVMKINETIEV